MKARPAAITALAMVLALAGPACRVRDLAFREDDRLKIVAPADRSEAPLPVTVRWTMRDNVGVGSFVVVVDRSPQPPGEGLQYFVRNDPGCKGASLRACLQPQPLADRGIYHTTERQITFDTLRTRGGVSKSEENRHEVTVALLDVAGRRMAEASWTVVFTARFAAP
jgi:hypothetical protein